MLIKNVTKKELENALQKVNLDFGDNIIFKRCEYVGLTRSKEEKWRVTLTVVNSREAGGRIGQSGRRVTAACWHAHGIFFDNLPSQAEINASGNKIRPGDEWVDRNIGSHYQPMNYSEACECYW